MLGNSPAIAQTHPPLSPVPNPSSILPEVTPEAALEVMPEATLEATTTTQIPASIPIQVPQPASAVLPAELSPAELSPAELSPAELSPAIVPPTAIPPALPATAPQSLPQSLFVDAQRGQDQQGNGSQVAPYRTLTQALQVASAGTVILLAPGVYDQAHGEVFPLYLQPDVTIQGNSPAPDRAASPQEQPAVVIQGGGALPIAGKTLNVAIVGADRAALVGVTVTNPNPQGYALWIDDTSPTIVESTFTGNAGGGMTIAGQGRPLIQRNQFQDNGTGIHVADAAQPLLRGNRLQENQVGILVTNQARPQLFHNEFRQNRDGLVAIEAAQPIVRQSLFVEQSRDGVVVLDQALPDLGTEKAAGNNQFQDNGRFDINAHAIATFIPAVGNSLDRDRSLGRIDQGGRITRRIPILAGQEAVLSAGGAATPVPLAGSSPSLETAASTALVPSYPAATTFPQPLLLAAAAPLPTTAPLTTAAHFPSPRLDVAPTASRLSTRYAAPVTATPSRARVPVPIASASLGSPARQSPAVIVATVPTVTPTGMALSPPQSGTSVPVATGAIAQAERSPTVLGPNPVLAVPSTEIPVGAAEGKPSVWQPGQIPIVPQAVPRSAPLSAPLPTTPVLSPQIPQVQGMPIAPPQAAPSTPGLPYRVVVQITNPQDLIRLQSLVPNALQVPGRPLLQVATFGDPYPATQLQKVLKRQGFQALVEQW